MDAEFARILPFLLVFGKNYGKLMLSFPFLYFMLGGIPMNYWEQFLAWISATAPKLLGAVLILIVGWQLSNAVAKIMAKAMERSKADYGFISFFVSLIKTLMKIIVCITAAGQFMDVTAIISEMCIIDRL